VIKPTQGFKTIPTASATIKGFEVMRMISKRQCFMLEPGAAGELRFVNRLFRLALRHRAAKCNRAVLAECVPLTGRSRRMDQAIMKRRPLVFRQNADANIP
jgi:hypothetical protein